MSEIIRTKDDKPFETEKAALMRQGQLAKQGTQTEVVKDEDGWALKTIARKRPPRVKLGTRNVLRYPERPGYHRHVFNDVDDNILIKQQAGYEIVQKKDLPSGDPRAGDATQMGMPVSKSVGGGVKGILMEIPIEWYEEDQKERQDKILEDENVMKQPRNDAGAYGGMDISVSA